MNSEILMPEGEEIACFPSVTTNPPDLAWHSGSSQNSDMDASVLLSRSGRLEVSDQQAIAYSCAEDAILSVCTNVISTCGVHLYLENKSNRRKYRFAMSRDLFGWLVMERFWGSLDSKRGGKKIQMFEPCQFAMGQACDLALRILFARKRHGYSLIGFVGVD